MKNTRHAQKRDPLERKRKYANDSCVDSDGCKGKSSASEDEPVEIGEFEPAEHDGGIMDFRTYISNEVMECVEKVKPT